MNMRAKELAAILTIFLAFLGCSDDTEKDEGGTDFFETPLAEQGISNAEIPVFEQAVAALIADPEVDFVATREDRTYRVHAARGSVFFRRVQTRSGYEYVEDRVEGVNPVGRQDPGWVAAYDEELAAGSNPNEVDLPGEGYARGDPRLSFIEPQDDSYPFGYERIAAYFDHPDSADFMVNPKAYAHAVGELGGHGSLGIVQSRCPLVLWGAGIRPGRIESHARQVDLAPTVARLLGMPATLGVDEWGIWSREVRLKWQDGHVLEEVLDGGLSQRVILVVCDGLAHTEFFHQIESRNDALPNLSRLVEEGAWFDHGSITNWPSVTYPGHNTIGSGLYSGHHGLVDNSYYLRASGRVASPISQLLLTEELFNPCGPGESLHMALHRSLGSWDPDDRAGAFTASLMDPSVRDADKADLEFRDRFYLGQEFPPLFVEEPPEVPGLDNSLQHIESVGEQLAEVVAMYELYHLCTRDPGAVPTYVILNFITTDGTGHANGPHGDEMKKVLDHIDANFGVLHDWLAAWGLLEETTIILTSDHGMQLGDPSRSGSLLDRLETAGIRYRKGTGMGVYLER